MFGPAGGVCWWVGSAVHERRVGAVRRRPLWQLLPTIVGQFAAYGLALILFAASAATPEPTGQYPDYVWQEWVR